MQPDSETALYIQQVRPYFEDLRQIAAQLAGLLVLSASSAKSAGPDHPLLNSARKLYGGALEGLHASRPTAAARAHHRHLADAAESLRIALNAAREIEIDPVLIPLRAAYTHLQSAARELPGFQMLDFSQGCCGVSQSIPSGHNSL